MTIQIEFDGTSNYTVRCGERFISHLGWDEMLGTVIDLTHPGMAGKTRFVMRTPAERDAWQSAWDKNYGSESRSSNSDKQAVIAEPCLSWTETKELP